MRKAIAVVVMFLVIHSVFVLGAGSSTGNSKNAQQTTIHEGATPEEMTPPPRKACEEYSGMQARITCRLEEKSADAVVEESCRVLPDKQGCVSLYKEVGPCYDLSGQEKDKCFKRIARFTHVTLKGQSEEKGKEPIRNYLVFLLYDLQERVEETHEDGEIDSETAASLITAIVEIKQAIMLGKPKAEIESRMAYLKQQWERYMA